MCKDTCGWPRGGRGLGAQVSGAASRFRAGWEAVRLAPSLSYHAQGGLAARIQLQAARYGRVGSAHWRVDASKTLAARHKAVQAALFLGGARRFHRGGLGLRFTARHLSLGLDATYDPFVQQIATQVSLQVQMSGLGLASRMSTDGSHIASAYGSISVGPGVRLTRALRDETAALLRVFEDLDGNQRLDAGEKLLPNVDVQLFHAPLARTASGALRASYLEPYAAYQVQIIEQSIHDPWLRPATGYAFSFVADPARTKVVDIPLQRTPLVRGRVDSFEHPPTRLRVRALGGSQPAGTAAVYRDGGFALRLMPGTYVLQLEDAVDDAVLLRQPLTVPVGTRILEVQLTKP